MILAKNKFILNFILVVAIMTIIIFILNYKGDSFISPWFLALVARMRSFNQHSPFLCTALFCLIHIISAMLSLPGSCTGLNILSGALFGLRKGIFIVYLVTLFSGSCSYLLGTKIRIKYLENKYKAQIESIKNHLVLKNYLFLVFIRLSPILPYGFLNLMLGVCRVPFFTFILTTIVGIFFDVVLLNGLGAFMFGNMAFETYNKSMIIFLFSMLFLTSLLLNHLRSRWIALKNQEGNIWE
jgi:uncharacterized membrane protein YdjX (TVP38/TMEM64 family)